MAGAIAAAVVPALPYAEEAAGAAAGAPAAGVAAVADEPPVVPTTAIPAWWPSRLPGRPGLFESSSPWRPPGWPGNAGVVRSASYPVDAGFVRIVPSVVVLPELDAEAPGLVAVGLEHAAAGDPLRWKAQIGWSGVPSGWVELDYRVAQRDVVFRGEERSALATLLPGGRAPGTLLESRWTERVAAHTSASAAVASNRLDLAGQAPSASSARLELRHRPFDRWTVLARVDGATYSDAATAGYRRGSVTLGSVFEADGVAVNAAYRNEASAFAEGGHGGRLSVRGTAGALRATAYADVQQQAETVRFDASNPADLPREIGDLGLVGMRPELAVQVIRDRLAVWDQYGLATGGLRVDPLRVQGGLDVAWRPASYGAEFGVRVAWDELDGSASPRRAVLGSLYTSWRVFGDADLTASYAGWAVRDGGEADENRGLFRMSLRAPL